MSNKLNCLSYWFPKIKAAGLPVPRTEIIAIPDDTYRELRCILDGQWPESATGFLVELVQAIEAIGKPCFLRTGQVSGKHNWKHTCYLSDPTAIRQHVYNLAEWSECAGFMGLPWNVWCVRELLPTEPVITCDRYGGMPVAKEFRVFVRNGQVACRHPYWPRDALAKGMSQLPTDLDSRYEQLCHLSQDEALEVDMLALRAGEAVTGAWSIDILKTASGWYVIDMACAEESFHWPGCPNAKTSEA